MTFTKHGHQIDGTIAELPVPTSKARCGGPAMCRFCKDEAMAHEGFRKFHPEFEIKHGYIKTEHLNTEHELIRYFEFEHLPEGNLRKVSEEFYELAHYMDAILPNGIMKSSMMVELLKAKDAAVRAALDMPKSD
jgi:hypothetical protein